MNEALRDYLLGHADEMTNSWYETLEEHDPISVYANTNPTLTEQLKEQNNQFHQYFANIFVEDEEIWFQKFDKWLQWIASDEEHLRTPSHYVIREFKRVRFQYLGYVKQFAKEHEVSQDQLDQWTNLVIRMFDQVVIDYVQAANENSKELLKAKEAIIRELSAPVIALDDKKALLPVIGEIDSERAGVILEQTLQQCAEKKVTDLYIDLSGVASIDTMVAHQISNLLQALKLLGITPHISGMRPEIANTSAKLGITFSDVQITSSLSNALNF
ncbi:STAS domain-containing protein [Thalassobacillus hwangdonensis]|uniref:STAS domain-containing protein n=1 Tax=Thalassobacillus hwangdonensis TaxID=546108 RepID=A0ABW3L7T8_9BACI